MKIHTDYMTVQTKEKREISNITQNLKFAVEKSGIRDGVVVVAALHSNSAVFIAEDDPGLHRDLEHWLEKLAPIREDYEYGPKHESNAAILLQNLALQGHIVVGLSEGRLDLGPWQQVLYADLDGQRPKRILIKLLGE
ncbi:MAG TPA: secondary thiamine-phosphate synthase enzyme YjbQ [Candidatus Acidoferrales bacterium]